ncbi:acyl-CoA dehydrogenase family protein [Cellulomonas phragmiteti]|uniref:Acyl-CoA dehydrogenase n=1 Tax=Cellulomonas phragmiteti TaxID=478780 RepID=A0ABQ4DR25_9CELL|nr:acyl-CoA dehydrogenase family protein [Cellulomonas phragmiteti]GIG41810.1 acyl-CoA dehydrogenase [Cellulomonas phragmiteti]
MSGPDLAQARRLADQLLQPDPGPALGTLVATRHGGLGLSHALHGEVCRLVAETSPSRQALLTVHAMVCRAVGRWGSEELRDRRLPDLATGRTVAAFALSEENAGSDVRSLAIECRPTDDGWELTGEKQWITYGLEADVLLVFAGTERGPLAALVDTSAPGVEVRACPRTSGFAEARLASVRFDRCRVPHDQVVGRVGSGLAHVAADALTLGRLSIAFASWGLARAALRAATQRAVGRHQFGGPLHERQLVRGLLADASVAVDAAQELCRRAARSIDEAGEWLQHDVLTAKLAASRAAATAAATAAQLHGAAGLLEGSPVDVMVRDARVYEVIEGNTQLLQDLVAGQVLARHRSGEDL